MRKMLAVFVLSLFLVCAFALTRAIARFDEYPHHGLPTEVWLHPVPQGDMLELFRQPESWARARAQTDVIGFYRAMVRDSPCGQPCGPNTFENFMNVVPGGAFRMVTQEWGKKISIEAAAVKASNCDDIYKAIRPVIDTLDDVHENGGRVDYISLDEPFFSGTNPVTHPGFGGCGQTFEWTAEQMRVYYNAINTAYPDVQIGLMEPYPAMTPDEIMTSVLALEAVGIRIPFFHLDLDPRHVTDIAAQAQADMRRLREFFHAKGIPFGVLIVGGDGRTNEDFFSDAWALFLLQYSALGLTEHTKFQSWAKKEFENSDSDRTIPDVLPDSNPNRHTGFLLRVLEYVRADQ